MCKSHQHLLPHLSTLGSTLHDKDKSEAFITGPSEGKTSDRLVPEALAPCNGTQTSLSDSSLLIKIYTLENIKTTDYQLTAQLTRQNMENGTYSKVKSVHG